MTAPKVTPTTLATSPVASPCIGICRMNEAAGLCDGCLRTIDEIAAWSTLDDEAKRAVWRIIEARHEQWMAQGNGSNGGSEEAPAVSRRGESR
jgi:uncharacterized protein